MFPSVDRSLTVAAQKCTESLPSRDHRERFLKAVLKSKPASERRTDCSCGRPTLLALAGRTPWIPDSQTAIARRPCGRNRIRRLCEHLLTPSEIRPLVQPRAPPPRDPAGALPYSHRTGASAALARIHRIARTLARWREDRPPHDLLPPRMHAHNRIDRALAAGPPGNTSMRAADPSLSPDSSHPAENRARWRAPLRQPSRRLAENPSPRWLQIVRTRPWRSSIDNSLDWPTNAPHVPTDTCPV